MALLNTVVWLSLLIFSYLILIFLFKWHVPHMLSIPHNSKQHKSFTHLSNSVHFLRLVDVHLNWVLLSSFEDISGQSHFRHSLLPYQYSWLVPDLFSKKTDYGFESKPLIIQMICAARIGFLTQIRPYRNSILFYAIQQNL